MIHSTCYSSKWCNTVYEDFILGRQFIHCLFQATYSTWSAPWSLGTYSSGQLPANMLPISFTTLRGFGKMFSWIEKGSLAILFVSLAAFLFLSLVPPCPLLFLSQQERREHLTGSSQPKAALCARSTVKDNYNSSKTKEKGERENGVRLMERNKHAVVQRPLKLYML